MLAKMGMLVLQMLGAVMSSILLVRFFMQWQRVSFHNQLGLFVITCSDWLVKPLRRIIPGWFGLDLASLLAAWLIQLVWEFARALLLGVEATSVLTALPFFIGLALFSLMEVAVHLVFVLILAVALLSWINPMAPVYRLADALARPFLRPFRRVLPLIANVDLSPLLVLLLLQLLLILIDSMRQAMMLS